MDGSHTRGKTAPFSFENGLVWTGPQTDVQAKPVFSAECTIGMVRGLTPLKHYGSMALWHYGTMALWHYGTMALWHYGTMALWRYGAMALWNYGNKV